MTNLDNPSAATLDSAPFSNPRTADGDFEFADEELYKPAAVRQKQKIKTTESRHQSAIPGQWSVSRTEIEDIGIKAEPYGKCEPPAYGTLAVDRNAAVPVLEGQLDEHIPDSQRKLLMSYTTLLDTAKVARTKANQKDKTDVERELLNAVSQAAYQLNENASLTSIAIDSLLDKINNMVSEVNTAEQKMMLHQAKTRQEELNMYQVDTPFTRVVSREEAEARYMRQYTTGFDRLNLYAMDKTGRPIHLPGDSDPPAGAVASSGEEDPESITSLATTMVPPPGADRQSAATAQVSEPDESTAAPGSQGGNLPDKFIGRCRVRYEYEAEQQDELDLHVGQIVYIQAKSSDGWYLGALPSGDEGYFPGNYVVEA
eukprot:Clim_evm1s47 gene=Clim_evmTU1s47